MHLIAPLMTGVRGAKNGTAHAYERGTTTPAPVYADASGKVRRYGALRLDSLGSMGLYVDRLVDVTVRDAGGEVVREWTDGRADGAVVVEHPAFTGVDEETGMRGIGERTTLEEALDRLYPSTRAVDFNVLIGTTVMPVYVAIGERAGAYFDVTRFGARANDTADDLGAIQAAIETARTAGGGIVYLPPGAYRVSGALALYETVSLLGDSSGSTRIVMTSDTAPLLYMFGGGDPESPALRPTHSVSGLTFVCELSARSTQPLLSMQSGSAVVSDCYFDGTFNAGPLVSIGALQRVRMATCSFLIAVPTSKAIDAEPLGRVNVDNCLFWVIGTRDVGVGLVSGSELHLEGCTFRLQSAVGDAQCVVLGTKAKAFLDGCETSSSGGGTVTLLVTGGLLLPSESVFEDCSPFSTGSPLRLYELTDNGGNVSYFARLKTVEARHAPVVQDLVATNANLNHPILPDISQYGLHSVCNKVAATVSGQESSLVIGVADPLLYDVNMNRGRTTDILYFCVTQEGFNLSENRFLNSVVPRFNFKANSLFAFRMISAWASTTTPIMGEGTRLHCLSCSAAQGTVNTAEREGYGPI